jgi:chromosome segregation ATPase
MSRVGIDKDAVAAAIEQLKQEGRSASVPEIRALTGGSFTTIQRYKKELEADQQALTGPEGRIRSDILSLVEQLEKKLLDRARLELSKAEKKLDQQSKAISEKLQLAEERARIQLERIHDLEGRLAKAEAVGQEYANKYNAANNELARQAVDLTHNQRESAARATQIEKLTHDLQNARNALEGYQEVMQRQRLQDQVQADSTAADLRARYDKLTAESNALRESNIQLIRDNQRLQTEQSLHEKQLNELYRQLDLERVSNKELIKHAARLEAHLDEAKTR